MKPSRSSAPRPSVRWLRGPVSDPETALSAVAAELRAGAAPEFVQLLTCGNIWVGALCQIPGTAGGARLLSLPCRHAAGSMCEICRAVLQSCSNTPLGCL